MTTLRTLLLIGATACGAAASSPPASTLSTPPASAAPAAAPGPQSFRVEVTGSGPPVILIPGLASSGETWTTTVAHLRDRYTCHVLTLAGFAGVPAIQRPLLPAVEAELADYIRVLGRPVVIGHSLGGELALMLAADHPRLVGPLVIVDSLPFLGAAMGAGTEQDARTLIERIRAATAGMTPQQREDTVRSGRMTNSMAAAPADQQRLIAWGLASDPDTVQQAMFDLVGTDLRPQLPRIAAPALVIASWIGMASSDRTPAERAATIAEFRRQYAALSRLHFAVTDTARHFVMLDDLPWFLRELDRFLADPALATRSRGFPTL